MFPSLAFGRSWHQPVQPDMHQVSQSGHCVRVARFLGSRDTYDKRIAAESLTQVNAVLIVMTAMERMMGHLTRRGALRVRNQNPRCYEAPNGCGCSQTLLQVRCPKM